MGSVSNTNEVYIQGDFSEPMSAQHEYSHQDMAPEQALSMYSKTMHKHTKEQFELAQKSARRRSGPSVPPNQSSTNMRKSSSSGSVSSTDS